MNEKDVPMIEQYKADNAIIHASRIVRDLKIIVMADMQNQINALQLQAATSNVLRFPNAWTYAGGVFPPVTTPAA